MVQAYDGGGNLSVIVVRFNFHSGNGDDSSAMTSKCASTKPIARSSLLPVFSETCLYRSANSLSDSDVQSEPNGRTIAEKPNYYFEYKAKMKEELRMSGSWTMSTETEIDDEGSRRTNAVGGRETFCADDDVTDGKAERGNGELSAVGEKQTDDERRGSEQQATAEMRQVPASSISSNNKDDSRRRFEAARRSIIEKLMLR